MNAVSPTFFGSYTGRFGGLRPDDIASMIHWWPGFSLTHSGGNVTGWLDQIGSIDMTVVGAPAYTARDASFNGHPSCDFDGANDYLYNAGNNIPEPLHIFVVYIRRGTGGGERIYDLRGGEGTAKACRYSVSGGGMQQLGTTSGNTVVDSTNTVYLIESVWNGASDLQRLNGGADATGTDVANLNATGIVFGGARVDGAPGGAEAWDGRAAEYAISSAGLSGNILAGLQTYFRNKYKIW